MTTEAGSSIASVGEAWRLTREPWADLSGEGARLKGGRWNSPGHAVVYLSQDAALPVLETLVHLDLTPDLLPDDYVLMRVDLVALENAAPGSWLEEGPDDSISEADSRSFGDRWIEDVRTPILRVSSVVVPESFNLIVNMTHPLASNIPGPTHRPFAFDPRLFDIGSDEDE